MIFTAFIWLGIGISDWWVHGLNDVRTIGAIVIANIWFAAGQLNMTKS